MEKKSVKLFQMSHISAVCLTRSLLKNLWMIIASGLIFSMGISMAANWLYVPQYQATMTYSVNSRATSYNSSGNMASTKEVSSVLTEFLATEVMLDSIRNHDPRLKDFNGTISAKLIGDSNFIVVTATADTPQRAFLSLKALTVVFPTMASFISSRNILSIMRNPTVSPFPSNAMNVSQLSQLGGLAGAALMAALLGYISINSETIQTRTGARQLLDAPILAAVIHERKNRTFKSLLKRSNKQVRVFSPTTSFAYVEQINSVCTHLEHEAATRQSKIFLITGVGENEGKSTVSSNVASALALKGHKVALLDCDLRNPSVHRFFGNIYNGTLPLNKMLALPYSTENLKQCMVLYEQINLYLLLTVHPDLRSTELLSGPTMEPLLDQLRVFDFVIVDTPPMGMFPDSEILADLVDASMLVVRQDYTAACDINDAIDTLNSCSSNFLGCILNDMRITLRSQYGYGSKYGKGSKYSHAGKYIYDHKSGKSDDTHS